MTVETFQKVMLKNKNDDDDFNMSQHSISTDFSWMPVAQPVNAWKAPDF